MSLIDNCFSRKNYWCHVFSNFLILIFITSIERVEFEICRFVLADICKIWKRVSQFQHVISLIMVRLLKFLHSFKIKKNIFTAITLYKFFEMNQIVLFPDAF